MTENEINEILDRFTKETGTHAKWRPIKKADYVLYDNIDGLVQLGVGKNKTEMPAEYINNIQNPHIARLLNLLNQNKKVIVLANTILPKFKQELRNLGINYIDAVGNAYLKYDSYFIWLDGRKQTESKFYSRAKPFSKTGLKVIFHLLLLDNLLNATIREIAKIADVSLDTVHKTISGLKDLKFIIPANKDTLIWDNKKELVDRWINEYESRLKPTLHVGNFRFFKEEEFHTWKEIHFKSTMTKWGGEPAGDLLTNYLKPEILTIYTDESKLDWIRNYKLVPDPKGYIEIYERFWYEDHEKVPFAPPLLIYADLINTSNRRNIETAKKIYEQYLQDKL